MEALWNVFIDLEYRGKGRVNDVLKTALFQSTILLQFTSKFWISSSY